MKKTEEENYQYMKLWWNNRMRHKQPEPNEKPKRVGERLIVLQSVRSIG